MDMDDRRDLAELLSDQSHPLLREAGDVNLDVEGVVNAPFRDDAARRAIEIDERRDDPG
jgi:hypothetical protein